jgi:hypothetical protein
VVVPESDVKHIDANANAAMALVPAGKEVITAYSPLPHYGCRKSRLAQWFRHPPLTIGQVLFSSVANGGTAHANGT